MDKSENKQSVLVVDDNPKILRFIEIDLKLKGYDVTTTTSGKEALKLTKSQKPDIMLLDIVMPGIDGLEVLKQLRAAFNHIPVIAFSASPGERDMALQTGADDFLIKPFQPDEMVRRIQAVLG